MSFSALKFFTLKPSIFAISLLPFLLCCLGIPYRQLEIFFQDIAGNFAGYGDDEIKAWSAWIGKKFIPQGLIEIQAKNI